MGAFSFWDGCFQKTLTLKLTLIYNVMTLDLNSVWILNFKILKSAIASGSSCFFFMKNKPESVFQKSTNSLAVDNTWIHTLPPPFCQQRIKEVFFSQKYHMALGYHGLKWTSLIFIVLWKIQVHLSITKFSLLWLSWLKSTLLSLCENTVMQIDANNVRLYMQISHEATPLLFLWVTQTFAFVDAHVY